MFAGESAFASLGSPMFVLGEPTPKKKKGGTNISRDFSLLTTIVPV